MSPEIKQNAQDYPTSPNAVLLLSKPYYYAFDLPVKQVT